MDAPAAYVTYLLCRAFHVLPSQVQAEPLANVWTLLACMDAEAEVEKMKGETSPKTPGQGGDAGRASFGGN